MNMWTLLLIYAVIMVIWFSYSRRKQTKAQEDRFASLKKGAEVETIGGLIGIVDEIDKDNNRIVLDVEGVYLPFDLNRSILKVLTPASADDTNQEDTAVESDDKENNETADNGISETSETVSEADETAIQE
ncbi:preprotein translocase subunit YajC [Streptococcus dentiloxodontae]